MERKIGEEFKYYDTILIVKECVFCDGCYFDDEDCDYSTREITGECSIRLRKDKNSVIFKKIKL